MKLSSLKYPILVMVGILIACMGGATIIEKMQGRDAAADMIYGSWWFISLWAVLAVMSFVLLIHAKVHKRMAVMLLHLSFVVILTGACITHFSSENGTVHLRSGKNISAFTDDDNMVHHLPFSLALSDFKMIYYPGTDAVMDYQCDITITEQPSKEQRGKEQTITVSMNNIGKIGGYRFYQSSYDSDMQGTYLLVAYDPYGIAVTYIGYVMLFVSLIWTMFSRRTRIRELFRLATKPAAMLAMLLAFLLAPSSLCASTSRSTQCISPVSPEIAHDLGHIAVLYNGRICPLNTVATDFVTKLSGSSTWNGYSADEVFLGWMIYYTEWETQPIIKVKNTDVQRLLGIDGKWASVRDFYTSDNQYKLKDKTNDLHLTDATRKAIRDVDEKIQVVTMFYNSDMLHIFPLTVDGKMQWYTPGSTELPLGTPEAEFQFINHAMDYLVKAILVNDVDKVKLYISKIKLYQREKAADVLPSAFSIKMEVLYNSLLAARWIVFLSLLLSIFSCIALFSGHRAPRVKWYKRINTIYIIMLAAYLTLILAMRWMISGHAPMGNGYETMLFMAWVVMTITIIIMKRIDVIRAFGPLVASLCMLVAMLAGGNPQITPLMPVLQSPLLTFHVAMVMVAYAIFAIITLLAVRCLWLGQRQQDIEFQRLTALSQLLLYPAVFLLAAGIFIGAVWANVSWGTYWSWDPKETWALITLLIYAVPLHRTFMPSSHRFYHLYILIAFLTVLMTYFGVNYFLTGMHSYA